MALQPTEPVSPRKTLNTVLGALVGGLVMAAILVVRFIMDDKIKTSEDITKYLGIPTLAHRSGDRVAEESCCEAQRKAGTMIHE